MKKREIRIENEAVHIATYGESPVYHVLPRRSVRFLKCDSSHAYLHEIRDLGPPILASQGPLEVASQERQSSSEATKGATRVREISSNILQQ